MLLLDFFALCSSNHESIHRGGVEDTRLEAKAKDTKKIRGQGQGQGQPFRGQTLSRPRTGMLEAKAKDQGHKAQVLSKKKKVFTKIFQAISTNKRFPKNFSTAPQNFNLPKNSAVLDRPIFEDLRPRGQGQGQGLDLRGQGQGLQNLSSRTSSRPRTSSRTPPLSIQLMKIESTLSTYVNIKNDVLRAAKLAKTKKNWQLFNSLFTV